jgi:hypothetical protein
MGSLPNDKDVPRGRILTLYICHVQQYCSSVHDIKRNQCHEVVSKRFCKKQQMQWSKEGAHLLLQTRVRTLNGELAAIFTRWYPDLDMKAEEIPIAA